MLPKSFSFLCHLVIYCAGFSLFILTQLRPVYAANRFYQNYQEHIQENNALTDDQISHDPANYYQQTGHFLNLTSMLVRLCIDETTCTKGPTAMDSIGSVIAMMYNNPPASGIAWTRHALENAGLVKPAYAQGIGFAALSPFLPLWQATRNIAYSLLIIVMIVIGFMLIFRTQIDAHTVISVQAAIPKIVLTILLITFSYPIVGFLVDLMYLSIAIVVSVLFEAVGSTIGDTAPVWQSRMMTGGMAQLFSSVMRAGFGSLDDAGRAFMGLNLGSAGLGGFISWFLVGSASIWALFLGVVGPAILFVLFLFFGLLFVFIRLLMLLANAYIQIIISLILGPLLLLNEAIPGRSAFKEWLFNIIANLSVFPATAMVLIFARFLTSSGVGGSWSPPFLPNWPGFGQGFFGAFLGICIMFLAPNLVVGVKKIFTPKPALPIGAGTLFSPITGGVQTTMGMASQYYYAGQMFSHGPIGAIIERFGGGQNHQHPPPGQ